MDPKTKRFVSEKLADAISCVKKINKYGVKGSISHIGEDISVKKQCMDYTFSYLDAIDQIEKKEISSSISIKLSQIGLAINQTFCVENLKKILKSAEKENVFVWIDAEEYKYFKKILPIFKHFSKQQNVGFTISSNMKGTGEILEGLIKQKARIRLEKGMCKEKCDAYFQTNFQIETNFIKLMSELFEKSDNFAIATHDLKLIQLAIKLQHRFKRNFEFQFLMGVSPNLEKDLAQAGYIVSEYVPYGKLDEYYKKIEENGLHLLGI